MLCMHPANERWHYTVMPFLIGRAHTQNDSWLSPPPFSWGQFQIYITHNLSITEHYIAKITTTYPGCSELIMQDCWICSATILSRMLMHWIQQFHIILNHDDTMTWKHFPHHWPFRRGIYQSLVVSLTKGLWCEALVLSLLLAWTNFWTNSHVNGDLNGHDPDVMSL